jgi:phenylacetate-CoA ligase
MPAVYPEDLSRDELSHLQSQRLVHLLAEILPRNRFYARKLAGVDPASIHSLEDLPRLPFTTKQELLADQEHHPPYGTVLTYPVESYSRLHQTSGTAGRPLRWLDTPESWAWMLDCWTAYYRILGVGPADRLFFPFSFGPFLGFWTAFDAASRMGCLCLPGGGMSSVARLRFLLDNQATVVLCTPTYALRLAEVARAEGMDLTGSSVRALIVAGEPGGSIPATRARIETAWGARVFDHSGMTEMGPATIEAPDYPGELLVLESDYIPEVIDPATGRAVPPGTPGELVLSNLGRLGSPLLRYQTGDTVVAAPPHRYQTGSTAAGRHLLRLEGGIRGRVDDMIVVRGNNLHPSALQTILHRFAELVEYRVEVDRTGALPVLRLDVEALAEADGATLVDAVARAIYDQLLFRAEVRLAPPGSLPRFEHKAQRLVRKEHPRDKPGSPE